MKIKGLLLFIQFSLIIIALLVSLGGSQALQENYLWITLSIFIVLTLPALISTVLFQRRYFGFTAAMSFLIYPLIFLLIFLIHKLTGIELILLGNIALLLMIILWNALLSIKIVTSDEHPLIQTSNNILLLLLACIAFGIGFSTVRQQDSIAALDYMQHQAVINQSVNLGRVCILPSSCSNIFLQNGYTTFYHTVLSFLTTFSGNNLEKSIYTIDIIWGILGILIVFVLLKNIFKRVDLAILGSLFASLIFINGAYEFNFFLPQTFAFFLFLNFLISKNLNWKKIIIASVLLILTHFIIGSVLAFILILKYLLIDRKLLDLESSWNFKTLTIFTALITVFTLLLNLAGFSFENSYQTSEVAYVGSSTNLAPPGNYSFVINLLGTGLILFIIALVFYFIEKKHETLITFSVIYILINLSLFFISPTYANKFLIGFGIFSTIIIINYLKEFKFTATKSAIIMICLVIVFLQPFITNYRSYLQFYSQSDGTVSIVNSRDLAFLNKLKEIDRNCTIISDPFTQSLITGYSNYVTAAGQYMSLESRRSLLAFITDPKTNTLASVKSIKEVNGSKDICFLYSSRLEIGTKPENLNWANNIYILPINNNQVISNTKVKTAITSNKGTVLYEDSYFQLFSI